jgi:hypothetical protein
MIFLTCITLIALTSTYASFFVKAAFLRFIIRAFATILCIVVVLIIILKQTDFFLIDECLDHGGVWDEKNRTCIYDDCNSIGGKWNEDLYTCFFSGPHGPQ